MIDLGGDWRQGDSNPEALGFSSSRLARISGWMRGWVDSGRLPGLLVAIARGDRPVWFETYGYRDVAARLPLEADTIFRIYSMTKPITSVAALMLYEEGHFQLDDPVSKFIPAFDRTEVFLEGDADSFRTEALKAPITVHDLMVHTSGLSYGFLHEHPVDALYRANGIEFNGGGDSLEKTVERTASMPLLFQPGTRWNYGVSTDILGRLVEIWSGMSLDAFFRERILDPLQMPDTDFHVPAEKAERLAACYLRGSRSDIVLKDSPATSEFLAPPATLSGGGGLVGTAGDYLRFMCMMRGGGAFGDLRLLGRKTMQMMVSNHLPGDLAQMGRSRFSETPLFGIGFGLGVSVMLDPVRARIIGSAGEYAWGGLASTAFWIDPVEDVLVLLLTQLIPSSAWPIRRELRTLVYQALI